MNGTEQPKLNRRFEDLRAVHNYAAKEQDRAQGVVAYCLMLNFNFKTTLSIDEDK